MLQSIGCAKKVLALLQFLAFILMVSGCLGYGYSPGDVFRNGLFIFLGLTAVMFFLSWAEKQFFPELPLSSEFDEQNYQKLLSAAKTNYTVRLVIDFYSRYDTSVRILSKQQSEDELHRDNFVLFCMFLLRQMHNLGDTGVDDAIGKGLLRINHSNMKTFNLGDYIHAADIKIQVPNLVEYRGKGEKGFDFSIDNEYSNPSRPTAVLDPWGFGSLGREVNYYATQAVNVLLRYVMIKLPSDDKRYQYCDAAKLCGEKYLSGIISYGSSQGRAAMDIYEAVFPDM